MPEYRPLVEAAYGQRALRGLHPFTSHRTHSVSPPAPALACRRPDAPGRTPRRVVHRQHPPQGRKKPSRRPRPRRSRWTQQYTACPSAAAP
ncbi:DUF6193 family natural product biosynthesis protein [Streptomyces atroolivaceus]|uniref:DUF6193 family natural product biosynthesis protein n=1 Tax=Streptomyces atroolivaceus TaxID=66869 RepID=UPI0034470452